LKCKQGRIPGGAISPTPREKKINEKIGKREERKGKREERK